MAGKGKVSYKDLMFRALNKMLKPGEKLQYPVYGTLFQETASAFGYFGFTKDYLLVALLDFKRTAIGEAFRVKLDVKKANVRRTWTGQYLIDIAVEDGDAYYFRLSRTVVGIDCQKENVAGFVEHLKTRYGV